ncbi:MAG: hypothetical protein SH850_08495 [Planctomycetaceae bacterium]|nr:hypothetical protein [Planctomycetaceae bacterium]
MATWFTIFAVFGGTLLVCQFVASLTGLASDHDVGDLADMSADHDLSTEMHDDIPGDHHSAAAFFKLLSFRTLVAGVTFFGIAGLAMQESEFDPTTTVFAALATGFLAMWCVHWLMQQIARLRSDGTVRLADAVGQTGVVYLSVPMPAHGVGKVTVNLADRTLELTAQSANGELPTGTPVRITRRLGPELVEVDVILVPSPSASLGEG